MYTLVIKNLKAERLALSSLAIEGYINESIIPLVEIVEENIVFDNKIDPDTQEVVREEVAYKTGKKKGQLHWVSVKDPESRRDETLSNIAQLLPGHSIFVDFFRCDMRKYKGADHSKCSLVIRLNNSLDEYKKRILGVSEYDNLIPVVTIKSGVDNFTPSQLRELIRQLKELSHGRCIAVRIDDIDGYEEVLETELEKKDYLLFDINEAPVASKEEDFEDVEELSIQAKKILICSPRRRDVKNGEFGGSYFIDNSHISAFRQYGFDGVGDYAGHCDRLKRSGGGKMGCALALVYKGQDNVFQYYVNHDSRLGCLGYREIAHEIIDNRKELERTQGECLLIKAAEKHIERDIYGNWSNWITYTIMRYVQQLYLMRNQYMF